MTDQRGYDQRATEQAIDGWLKEERPPLTGRDQQLDQVLGRLDTTPQARRRLLGRWLDSGHPPHRHPGRNRLMFSATGLVAAIAVLALSVSVMDPGPSSPSAGGGTTHTVAPSGADFESISAAVDAAADGDTILIGPGSYADLIIIDKDISLIGVGATDEIVITAIDEPPVWAEGRLSGERFAIHLDASDAELSGFTLTGSGATMIVEGGAPTISDLVFDGVNAPDTDGEYSIGNAMALTGDTRATVRDNAFVDSGAIASLGAAPLILGNSVTGGGNLWGIFGDGAIVRGNTITGSLTNGIAFTAATAALIEDNVISSSAGDGITTYRDRTNPTIRGNVIRDNGLAGISLISGSSAEITDNDLTGNGTAITFRNGDLVIRGNRVDGGRVGIAHAGTGAPVITGNDIDVEGFGIVLARLSQAVIDANSVCGAEASMRIADGASPDIGENEICDEA